MNDPSLAIRLRAINYAFPFAPQTVYLEKLNVDVQALWRGVQFGPLERRAGPTEFVKVSGNERKWWGN